MAGRVGLLPQAVHDGITLTAQESRARQVIEGQKAARSPRFVKTAGGKRSLDEASLARARQLAGLKGYVTNIPANVMAATEIIGSYHDLWHVEQSFRMSKSDLRARPMFHCTRDAIEAHLTIVFTALAVSRTVQARTGLAVRNVTRQLRTCARPPSRSTARPRHSLPPSQQGSKPSSMPSTNRNSRTKRMSQVRSGEHAANQVSEIVA
jgi:hypothetical protein